MDVGISLLAAAVVAVPAAHASIRSCNWKVWPQVATHDMLSQETSCHHGGIVTFSYVIRALTDSLTRHRSLSTLSCRHVWQWLGWMACLRIIAGTRRWRVVSPVLLRLTVRLQRFHLRQPAAAAAAGVSSEPTGPTWLLRLMQAHPRR